VGSPSRVVAYIRFSKCRGKGRAEKLGPAFGSESKSIHGHSYVPRIGIIDVKEIAAWLPCRSYDSNCRKTKSCKNYRSQVEDMKLMTISLRRQEKQATKKGQGLVGPLEQTWILWLRRLCSPCILRSTPENPHRSVRLHNLMAIGSRRQPTHSILSSVSSRLALSTKPVCAQNLEPS
jgi:hypothetical protein